MDALRTAVEVWFLEWDYDEVINSLLHSDLNELFNSGKKTGHFESLFAERNKMFSTNVISSISSYLESCTNSQSFGKTPFSILAYLGSNMLTAINNEPVCRYEHFLRWNEISAIVGEDMLTIPFLVNEDTATGYHRSSFDWKPFIRTDSVDVDSFLKRGLSELHFHLKGSTTVFDLNWLAYMNKPSFKDVRRTLLDISDHWQLYPMVMKACVLRLALFLLLNDEIGEYDELSPLFRIVMKEDRNVDLWSGDIQRCISTARETHGYRDSVYGVMDYAIPSNVNTAKKSNLVFIGERKLLYDCLWHVKSNGRCADRMLGMLYAYLLAKNKFRQSLIQNNKLKGFSNFQKYDRRKEGVIGKDSLYSPLISNLAVQCTIQNQNIKDLELRITPRNTSLSIEKEVQDYSKYIDAQSANGANIGFILHFIKQKDLLKSKDDNVLGMSHCRNYKVRYEIDKQANAIVYLISKGSSVVKTNPIAPFQIVGIDAAGSEFCCRPEVFGPVYRKIKLARREAWLDDIRGDHFCQLGRTFHVGEDFYDIIDGLRAIEESVLFLNLDRGDRIGHGVALGIDARQYYKERHYTLVMNKQCLLDNVSWMLMKMDNSSIVDNHGLKGRLNETYDRLIKEVYKKDVPYRQYCDSWLLRGDYPDIDYDGKKDELYPFRCNEYTPELRLAHCNRAAQELFVQYHYDSDVWRIGCMVEEIKIQPTDVRVVEDLQCHLRKIIIDKEIAVECNPTSNLHITDVRRYAEHPILKMNSQWLKKVAEEMSVSINTDDQGVFATSLEKEYTLMALSLEKEKDEDGNNLYSKGNVFRWLEDVRRMAYDRSFLRV